MNSRTIKTLSGLPAFAGAGLLLALVLFLAYGPARLAGHLIYGGVIQDLTNLYGFYCWDEFSRSELLAGRFPLWNPYNAFGVPHLANMQSAIFYPLNWAKWLFGVWPVIDLVLLVRLWLAGLFAWMLARRALGASFWAALVGGTAFMLSGYFTRYVYMSHLNVEILLPLALYLVHPLGQSGRRVAGSIVLSAAAIALMVLGGFPEAALYGIGFSLVYLLFAREMSARSAVTGLAVVCAGLCISAAQWLPFAEYYSQAWTYHDAASGLRSLDPRLGISLVLPWFFGENRLSPAVPFLSPYLGVVPFMLALYALFGAGRAGREAIFFLGAALVVLCLIYGVPPVSWAGRVFPLNLTYNDKYAAPVLALCVAMAAARGLDLLVAEEGWRRFMAACMALLVWMGLCVFLGLPPRHWFRPLYALGLLKPGLLAEAASLVVVAAVVFAMRKTRLLSTRAAAIAFFALCAAGLVFDLQGHTPAYHDDLENNANTVRIGGEKREGDLRVHADPAIDLVFPNRLLPAGVSDLRYYDPLYPRRYVDYMALVNGLDPDEVREHYNANMLFIAQRDRLATPLLRLAGVGDYILAAPWDELPMGKKWSKEALTISPRGESWLRFDRATCGGFVKDALMDHAPVRIEVKARISGGGRGKSPAFLFEAGLPDHQVLGQGHRGDGVGFMVLDLAGGKPHLAFSRYYDPKSRPEEMGWKPFQVELAAPGPKDQEGYIPLSLVLLPGPQGDATRDAAAWGSVRVRDPGADKGLSFTSPPDGYPYIYADRQAYPRVRLVRRFGVPPEGTGYMEALGRIAEVNPNTFKSIVLLPAEEGMETFEGRAEEATPALTASLVPGRIEVKYALKDPTLLVISDQYFPGWMARIESGAESHETRVLLGNGAFMVVPLSSGEGRSVLTYRPWAFRVGLWVSLFSLPAAALVLAAGIRGMRPPAEII